MKKLIGLLAAAGLAVAVLASPAQASLIYLGQWDIAPPLGSLGDEAAWIEGELNLEDGYLSGLTKYEGGSFGEGEVSGDYFGATASGPEGDEENSYDISWDLTGSGWEAYYVLIKDGNDCAPGSGNPCAIYRLYEVSRVDGDYQGFVGSGTVGFDGRDVSHISWFGRPGGTVPDGGMTLTLLGSALVFLGALRRRL